MQYTHRVILEQPYCGTADWGCLSMQHAESLRADFLARGIAVVEIRCHQAA